MDLMTQHLKLKEIFPDAIVTAYSQKYGVPKEDIEFIRKGFTPEEIKFVDGEKAVVSYINTAAIDRDSEVTLPEGGIMDGYKENPVVMFGHDYKSLPIGKCDSLKLDAKGWQGKTVYANTAKANEVYEYRRGGFPLAESIGFIPVESLTPGDAGFDELAKDLAKRGAFKRGDVSKIRRIHSKWAMLEYSDVPIPSNPEALQIAIAKGLVLPEIEREIPEEVTNVPNLVTKPEETDNFIRIPINDCQVTATIDISKDEGIEALYCGKEKKIRTYLFRKDKGWTMEKAKAWVKEHSKGISPEALMNGVSIEDQLKKVSQEEIIDEIDYLLKLIESNGMNEEVKKDAMRLSKEIMRLTGSDIPEKIKQEIKPESKPEVTMEQIQAIVAREIATAIRKAQGALE